MTEMVERRAAPTAADRAAARLKRRYAAERRFKAYGLIAIAVALGFLATLLVTVFSNGLSAFVQTNIRIDVTFDPAEMGLAEDRSPEALAGANYLALVKTAVQARFPEVEGRSARRELAGLVSTGADIQLRDAVLKDPSLIGTTRSVKLLASDDVDMAVKGKGGRLTEQQVGWVAALDQAGAVSVDFNRLLWTSGDSREPELAGLWGAIVGSFYSLSITLLVCFPLGVATAVYLEEFAPKNRWTDLIEVNINNLAAVPSVVFGLLGLAIFLNFFGMPRSAPLVGGLVLALISLPTIIIAARAALKAVPPSIREAALGLGASRLQMVTDHVLPLAMPGILTGTILGMAHALGETAPLLMIGMVAFIVDIPGGPLDPAAVLPVQVYLWADSPERAFVERTSAAIIVLLGFLALMNLAAILLRKKFERRW